MKIFNHSWQSLTIHGNPWLPIMSIDCPCSDLRTQLWPPFITLNLHWLPWTTHATSLLDQPCTSHIILSNPWSHLRPHKPPEPPMTPIAHQWPNIQQTFTWYQNEFRTKTKWVASTRIEELQSARKIWKIEFLIFPNFVSELNLCYETQLGQISNTFLFPAIHHNWLWLKLK